MSCLLLYVDQLILTHHFPFKLNGKVLQVLVSIFLYHDFSVRNFIKGLKVTGAPNSPLPCTLQSADQ